MRYVSSLQTLLTLAERTADTYNSSSFKVESCHSLRILANVTVNAGSDDLDVYIQGSPDNSTWWCIGKLDTFSSVKADDNSDMLTQAIIHPPKYIRVSCIIDGTMTFGVQIDKKAIARG